MKRFYIIIAIALTAILSFLLGNSLTNVTKIELVKPTLFEISYADFIVILLTCIVVMITLVTVGVGFMTIVGWKNLKASAVEEAAKVVENELKNSESDLSKRLVKSALKGITSVNEDATEEGGEFD